MSPSKDGYVHSALARRVVSGARHQAVRIGWWLTLPRTRVEYDATAKLAGAVSATNAEECIITAK